MFEIVRFFAYAAGGASPGPPGFTVFGVRPITSHTARISPTTVPAIAQGRIGTGSFGPPCPDPAPRKSGPLAPSVMMAILHPAGQSPRRPTPVDSYFTCMKIHNRPHRLRRH